MPFKSQAQSAAFHAAAEGRSTLGIPQGVAKKFVADSAGQQTSPLPEYVQAQQGMKRKSRTHRGRRGKGAKAHHQEGKTHVQNAMKATTPAASLGHLFKAIRSMHAAKQATAPTETMDQT